MIRCNLNFEYRIPKISNKQCNISRSWSKPVSTKTARAYRCSFSYKLFFEIKLDAPNRGHHVYKEIWTPQKDDILYCKKDYRLEVLGLYKHAVGIYKEDRIAGHRFMTGDPIDCMSRRNL